MSRIFRKCYDFSVGAALNIPLASFEPLAHREQLRFLSLAQRWHGFHLGLNGFMTEIIKNEENDKGGENFVREAGGEVKNHKGGGRRTPCVPPWSRGEGSSCCPFYGFGRIMSAVFFRFWHNFLRSFGLYSNLRSAFCAIFLFNVPFLAAFRSLGAFTYCILKIYW